jgi:RHS repeat-associated protein
MTFKSDIGAMTYGANGAGPHALTKASVANLDYSYDPNGNISAKTPGYTYQFDHKDRLASARRTVDGADVRYTYDAKGSRISKSVSIGGATATTLYADKFTELRGDRLIKQIFAGDRLVARINSLFDTGKLTDRKTLTIADFDKSPKDGVITIQEIRQQGYDPTKLEGADVADAFRIYQANRETVPGLLPFGTMAQTLNELGVWSTFGETVMFFLPDHLGSASIITDTNGQVVEESVYYPYGKDRTRSGPYRSEYRYTGKELDDETGLHYFGARYYDSVTGRFVSVDPKFLGDMKDYVEKPSLLNLYHYGYNNPIKFNDPSGLAANDKASYQSDVSSGINKVYGTREQQYQQWVNDYKRMTGSEPNSFQKWSWEKMHKVEVVGQKMTALDPNSLRSENQLSLTTNETTALRQAQKEATITAELSIGIIGTISGEIAGASSAGIGEAADIINQTYNNNLKENVVLEKVVSVVEKVADTVKSVFMFLLKR